MDRYFKELSCEESTFLAILFKVVIEKVEDADIWNAK